MVILAICIVSIAVVASATGEITSGGESVATNYAYHSELVLPSRHFSLNGTNYPSRATLTFPSGKKTTFKNVLLDEVGNYDITYTANVEGTVKTESFAFAVKASPADLWDTNVMIDTANNAKVPSVDEKGAVLLSAHERAEAKYVNPVYVGDNRKGDDLMTFVVAPTQYNQAEFESFYIVVEDYEDASNRLYIRFTRGFHEIARERFNTTITVSTDGKTWLGTDGNQYDFKKNSIASAYVINGSGFYGKLNDGSLASPLKVSLDALKKTVTVTCSNSLTFDLTDEKIVGIDNAWKGIDSGLAYVYAGFMEKLTSAPASVAIYTIDGISMGGDEVSSDKEPSIIIDDSAFENKIIAKKGAKHKFLNATVVDAVYGELDYSVKAYKVLDDVLEGVPSAFDGFVPTVAGKYYVEYVSEANLSGVSGVNGYYLDVLEPETCAINYTFGSIIDSIKAGNVINIPKVNPTGGVGKIKVSYSAKIGNIDVPVVEGTIIPEYTGELVITATCTDVIQTMTFTKNVTITANDDLYFDLGYIPSTMLAGDVLDLTGATAYKFGVNGKENVELAVNFAGAVVSNKLVVPTATQAGAQQLKIVAGGQERNFDIKVVAPASASGMIKDFFTVSSGEILSSTSKLQVVSSADTKIEYIREVDKNFLSFEFVSSLANAKFTHLKVSLYDTLDASNYVQFDILNNPNAVGQYSSLSYVGVNYNIYGTFRDAYGTIPFVIKYDPKTNSIYDYEDNHVVELTTRADGKTFNGFKGNVRFAIDVCGVSEEFKLDLKAIGEQKLKKNVTNKNEGPELIYNESFAPAQTDSEYVLPSFKMFDVLNNVAGATLSVKNPNGAEIYTTSDLTAFKFIPDVVGEYTLTISAKDDKGNVENYVTKINVSKAGSNDFIVGGIKVPSMETIPPTLTINTKPTTKATVGTAFNIAKITVSDDKTELKDIKLYAYVISPSGIRTLICCTPVVMEQGESITAEEKLAMFTDASAGYLNYTANSAGKYIVYYVVKDDAGLTSIAHYTVEVVANNG